MEAVVPRDYLRWRESSLGALTEELEQELVFELAGELEGRRVLDVGCGDGAYAVAVAERGAHVVGLDTSARMRRAASDRAASKGLALDLREGDVRQLPFDDASFDVVLAVTVLCFVEDASRALSEMARVLAPVGRKGQSFQRGSAEQGANTRH